MSYTEPTDRSYLAPLVFFTVLTLVASAGYYAWRAVVTETLPAVEREMQVAYRALSASLSDYRREAGIETSRVLPVLEHAGGLYQHASSDPRFAGTVAQLMAEHARLLPMISPLEQFILFCRERRDLCNALADYIVTDLAARIGAAGR